MDKNTASTEVNPYFVSLFISISKANVAYECNIADTFTLS